MKNKKFLEELNQCLDDYVKECDEWTENPTDENSDAGEFCQNKSSACYFNQLGIHVWDNMVWLNHPDLLHEELQEIGNATHSIHNLITLIENMDFDFDPILYY